jgi:hypothetical protein
MDGGTKKINVSRATLSAQRPVSAIKKACKKVNWSSLSLSSINFHFYCIVQPRRNLSRHETRGHEQALTYARALLKA